MRPWSRSLREGAGWLYPQQGALDLFGEPLFAIGRVPGVGLQGEERLLDRDAGVTGEQARTLRKLVLISPFRRAGFKRPF
jgi:hypothetical protein